MTETGTRDTGLEPVDDADVPEWEDEYVDRVSDRLMFNYDLEKAYRVEGEAFDLYGEMRMLNEKRFLHPALVFAQHESFEHVFLRRTESVSVADFERLVDLGHALADEWIDAHEDHFSTEFTFAVVTDSISEDVRSFVTGFSDRTLLKYGYHGHYEIHLVAVAPDEEELAASGDVHVEQAFRLWDEIEKKEPGLFELITRRLQI